MGSLVIANVLAFFFSSSFFFLIAAVFFPSRVSRRISVLAYSFFFFSSPVLLALSRGKRQLAFMTSNKVCACVASVTGWRGSVFMCCLLFVCAS